MLFGQTSCDKSPEDDKYLSKVFPGCAQWLATDDTRYKLGLIKITLEIIMSVLYIQIIHTIFARAPKEMLAQFTDANLSLFGFGTLC